jgi:hypothetical protein
LKGNNNHDITSSWNEWGILSPLAGDKKAMPQVENPLSLIIAALLFFAHVFVSSFIP